MTVKSLVIFVLLTGFTAVSGSFNLPWIAHLEENVRDTKELYKELWPSTEEVTSTSTVAPTTPTTTREVAEKMTTLQPNHKIMHKPMGLIAPLFLSKIIGATTEAPTTIREVPKKMTAKQPIRPTHEEIRQMLVGVGLIDPILSKMIERIVSDRSATTSPTEVTPTQSSTQGLSTTSPNGKKYCRYVPSFFSFKIVCTIKP